jgi:hypothetical protein
VLYAFQFWHEMGFMASGWSIIIEWGKVALGTYSGVWYITL